jgi:L-asparaginase / beta-aspartyl-peptidase
MNLLELLDSSLGEEKSEYGIVTHGGAGSLSPSMRDDIDMRREVLRKASSDGYAILRKGGSAVDAVEASIIVLEDSKIFNAGAAPVSRSRVG